MFYADFIKCAKNDNDSIFCAKWILAYFAQNVFFFVSNLRDALNMQEIQPEWVAYCHTLDTQTHFWRQMPVLVLELLRVLTRH
jgi:hypothetical protein